MNRFCSVFLAPLAMALTMTLASAASAGEAQDYVQARHNELTTVLRQPASAARATRITALLESMLDFDSIAKTAIGENANGRSEAELKEYQEVLTKIIKRNYQRNIQKTLNYTITYQGEDPGTEGVVVHTTVEHTKANGETETFSIDYRLHQKDGRWMVFDVITDQSSMVNNYRNSFNKTIRKDGWVGFVQKLRRKLTAAN